MEFFSLAISLFKDLVTLAVMTMAGAFVLILIIIGIILLIGLIGNFIYEFLLNIADPISDRYRKWNKARPKSQ